jgi:hypothetical protein
VRENRGRVVGLSIWLLAHRVVDGSDPRSGGIAGIVGQGAWRHRMRAVDCLGESRVRENLTHGLGKGCCRRSSQTHGDGLSPRWETSGPRQPGLRVRVVTAPAPYFTVVILPGRPGRGSRAATCTAKAREGAWELGAGAEEPSGVGVRRLSWELERPSSAPSCGAKSLAQLIRKEHGRRPRPRPPQIIRPLTAGGREGVGGVVVVMTGGTT